MRVQGSVLDRIDCNIERAEVSVDEGYKQLQRAEKYQRGSRKMLLILILICIAVLLIILLVLFKLN